MRQPLIGRTANLRAQTVNKVNIDCSKVIQEVSNFIEGDVPAELRLLMEAHFLECAHCYAILDGTRNVIQLVADDKVFDVPAGFGMRLAKFIRDLKQR